MNQTPNEKKSDSNTDLNYNKTMKTIKDKKDKKDECIELKNIEYKTMLMNGNYNTKKTTENNMSNIEEFLEMEKQANDKEPWNKLDKTLKQKKLHEFAISYCNINGIPKSHIKILTEYLNDLMEKKRFTKAKDITYDKTQGVVKNIPNLEFNKKTTKFNLKKTEKQQHSILKGLAPKQTRKILKSKRSPSKGKTEKDKETK